MTAIELDEAAGTSDCEAIAVSDDVDPITAADDDWIDAALDWDGLFDR